MGPARGRPGSDRRFRRPPELRAVGLLVEIEEARLDVGLALSQLDYEEVPTCGIRS
jgi:hypothetical protein